MTSEIISKSLLIADELHTKMAKENKLKLKQKIVQVKFEIHLLGWRGN